MKAKDFSRAIQDLETGVQWARLKAVEDPIYVRRLHSYLLALEALQLVRQHGMEGVVLGRVSDERPCGGSGVQGPECARCRRRCIPHQAPLFG